MCELLVVISCASHVTYYNNESLAYKIRVKSLAPKVKRKKVKKKKIILLNISSQTLI